MSASHRRLLDIAKEAVANLGNDRSVPNYRTMESLEEIVSDCEERIDAIRCDMNEEDE